MKQKFLLKTMLLLCLMMVGAGTAWADELTIGFEDDSYTDWTLTTILTKQTNSGVPAHGGSYYGGTNGKESGSVVTKEKIASPQSIKFYVSKESTNTNASSVWKIMVSTDRETWTQVGDNQNAAVDITKGTWTEVTRDLSSYSDVYVGVFYDGTTAKRCIDDITITYGSADTRTATTIAINDNGITNTDVYTSTAAGTLAATVMAGDVEVQGATITWASGNEDVATIENDGVVTLVAAGTTTITASYAGNDSYKSSTATYTLIVTNNDPNAPGTENNPYTVAQARAAIDANAGVTGVYATGKVSAIVTEYNSQYSNITFDISSDGETSSDQLCAYRCVGTDASDVRVGDEVVIYGDLTFYTKESIYEFTQGCQLVSLTHPVVTTPSITVNTNSIEATADGADGTITVTYNNITDVEAEVYFCDADGNTATYDWIEAEINGENNVEYVIDANEGAARTAYIKVYALDDDDNVYSDLITITQEAYVAPEETIGNFVKVTSTNDITSGQYLIVYEDGLVAFDGSLETLDAVGNTIAVTIENDKIAATTTNVKSVFNIDVTAGTLQSASGCYIGVSSNSNGLKQTEVATTYTHSFSIDDDGNAVISAVFDGSSMSLRYNSASNQVRFRYYKDAGQKAIQLYKFIPDNVTISVTDAGYATYCSEYALDFSAVEGLTAYKATVANNQVTFSKVNEVPAREGVLLKGAEGTYTVPVIASATAIDNDFEGVLVDTEKEAGIYVLMNPDGGQGVGFYQTTQSFTVRANSAYLPALAGNGARTFIALDDVTSVKGITAETMQNGEVYNLQGQRVMKAQKGLYIMNGKKVLVK